MPQGRKGAEAEAPVAHSRRPWVFGRRLSLAAYLVSMLPVTVAAAMPLHEGLGYWLLRLLTGLALTSALWLNIWSLKFLPMSSRTAEQIYALIRPPIFVLITWTGLSVWFIHRWDSIPLLHGAPGIAILSFGTLLGWCFAEGQLSLMQVLPQRWAFMIGPLLVALTAPLALLRLVTGYGLFIFFAATVRYPNQQFIVISFCLSVVELALRTVSTVVLLTPRKRIASLRLLGNQDHYLQDRALQIWALELLYDPKGKRGSHLIDDLTLMAHTARFAKGWSARIVFGKLAQRDGGFKAADNWIEIAERALDILQDLKNRGKGYETADRTIMIMLGNFAAEKAELASDEQRWDEALRFHDIAASQFSRGNASINAALEALSSADILSKTFDRTDEAEERMKQVITNLHLPSWVRQLAAAKNALAIMRQGRQQEAGEIWTQYDNILFEARDLEAYFSEASAKIGRLPKRMVKGFLYSAFKSEIAEARMKLSSEHDDRVASEASWHPSRFNAALSFSLPAIRVKDQIQGFERLHQAGRDLKAYRQMSQFTASAQSPDKLSSAYFVAFSQACTAFENADELEAYRVLMRAFSLEEETRAKVASPDYRAQTELHDSGYAFAITLLFFNAGNPGFPDRPFAEALWISELSRSRALLDLLAEPAMTLLPDETFRVNAAESDRYCTTLNQHDVSTTEGNEALRGNRSVDSIAQRLTGLARTSAWDKLDGAGIKNAEYDQLQRGSPLQYDELKMLLPADRSAILVEYIVDDLGVFVFVGRRDYSEPILIPVQLSAEDIEGISTAFTAPSNDAGNRFNQLEGLKRLVIPLLEHCRPDDLIWFVPHRSLHRVPLHAIPAPDLPLATRNPVCVTPSASIMRFCQLKRTFRYDTALTLADSKHERPLAHARAEADTVSRLFPNIRVNYSGAEVTRQKVLDTLSAANFDVIHIACHGVFNAQQPLLSGIDLADNDRLTVKDLLALKLQSNLIVLSACESGLSSRRDGDELVGLTRSLLYAGAPSILVSLWNVDDISTGLLMRRFYNELLSGAGKADALRSAERFIMQATVSEAIAYCEEIKGLSSEDVVRETLEEDIVQLLRLAGDFERIALYLDQSAERLDSTCPERQDLHRAAARYRARQNRSGRPDYERRPYVDPHQWAPFVLIGDWQ